MEKKSKILHYITTSEREHASEREREFNKNEMP
jgi:hypothetical protein